MGQKVHPVGLRLGKYFKWKSNWFLEYTDYAKFLHINFNIDNFFKGYLFYYPLKTLLVKTQIIKTASNKLFIFVFFYRMRPKKNIIKQRRYKFPLINYKFNKRELTKNYNYLLTKKVKKLFDKKKTIYNFLLKKENIINYNSINSNILNIDSQIFNLNNSINKTIIKLQYQISLIKIFKEIMKNDKNYLFDFYISFYKLIKIKLLFMSLNINIIYLYYLYKNSVHIKTNKTNNIINAFNQLKINIKTNEIIDFNFLYESLYNNYYILKIKHLTSYNNNFNKNITDINEDSKDLKNTLTKIKKINLLSYINIKNNNNKFLKNEIKLYNKIIKKIFLSKILSSKENILIYKILFNKNISLKKQNIKYFIRSTRQNYYNLIKKKRNFFLFSKKYNNNLKLNRTYKKFYKNLFKLRSFNKRFFSKKKNFNLKKNNIRTTNNRLKKTTNINIIKRNYHFKASRKKTKKRNTNKISRKKIYIIDKKKFLTINDLKITLKKLTYCNVSILFINALSFSKFNFYIPQKNIVDKKSPNTLLIIQRQLFNMFKYSTILINDLIYVTFISIFFKNLDFLANFIGYQFQKTPKTKRHTKLIQLINKTVKIFCKQRKEIIGVRLQYKGRINGRRRYKTMKCAQGLMPLQSNDCQIQYGHSKGITTYGAIGIKIWVCYKKNFYNEFHNTFYQYLTHTSMKMLNKNIKNTKMNMKLFNKKKFFHKSLELKNKKIKNVKTTSNKI